MIIYIYITIATTNDTYYLYKHRQNQHVHNNAAHNHKTYVWNTKTMSHTGNQINGKTRHDGHTTNNTHKHTTPIINQKHTQTRMTNTHT